MKANTIYGILSLSLLLVSNVFAIREKVIDQISPSNPIGVAAYNGSAASRRTQPCTAKGGAKQTGFNQAGFPCNTWDNENVNSFPGTGPTIAALPQDIGNNFVDRILVQSDLNTFNTITGMAFTDNTDEIFITAKAGIVFRFDQTRNVLTPWIDVTANVHNAGDHGLLSVETHNDFKNNPYVYLTYSVTSLAGPNDDMNAISYMRVVRITNANGVGDQGSIVILIGKDKTDAPPMCSSTHAGGALAMGRDGSLFVTFGDGGHFDTDVMDFGQVQKDRYPYDDQCGVHFPGQNMGALRAQSFNSLAGKLLRLDPTDGKGICPGNTNTKFTVYNPYCDSNARSIKSRIYAMGLRNPFSMNLRPLLSGESAAGPGVPYFGDVGLGSFEEINAVTQPGLNFGWPCWEGPRPMAGYRDSPMNNRNTYPNIVRPIDQNGNTFTCPTFYPVVETAHPTYYWSRYTPGMWGLYGEQFFGGYGYVGNCVTGVAFYNGNSYPADFKGRVFIQDYGAGWIKSLKMNGDNYNSVQDFRPNAGTPIVSLESNPRTGDICYIGILEAKIHCVSYAPQPVPPILVATANVYYGAAPLTVQFSTDGTFDRDNTAVNYVNWNFGDNSPIAVEPNPSHVFKTRGVYQVKVTISNANFNSISTTVTITVDGYPAPKINILSPATNGEFANYGPNTVNYFAVTATGIAPLKYYWDTWMVHLNHYHPQSFISNVANYSVAANDMGAASHAGARINYLVNLKVTDARGTSSSSSVRLREADWQTAYGNSAPVASFKIGGIANPTAGQYVNVDATACTDNDLDFLVFSWDFGDGIVIPFDPQNAHAVTSHAYRNPGTFSITMRVMDNWGAISTASQQVVINSGYPQNSALVNSFPTPTGQVPGTFVNYDPPTSSTVAKTSTSATTAPKTTTTAVKTSVVATSAPKTSTNAPATSNTAVPSTGTPTIVTTVSSDLLESVDVSVDVSSSVSVDLNKTETETSESSELRRSETNGLQTRSGASNVVSSFVFLLVCSLIFA